MRSSSLPHVTCDVHLLAAARPVAPRLLARVPDGQGRRIFFTFIELRTILKATAKSSPLYIAPSPTLHIIPRVHRASPSSFFPASRSQAAADRPPSSVHLPQKVRLSKIPMAVRPLRQSTNRFVRTY